MIHITAITVPFALFAQVLWPYLLEMLVPAVYTDALAAVSKSLAYLAAKKREAQDEEYMIDFDKLGTSSLHQRLRCLCHNPLNPLAPVALASAPGGSELAQAAGDHQPPPGRAQPAV